MAAATEVKKVEKKKVAKPKAAKTGDEKKVAKKAAATTPSKEKPAESKPKKAKKQTRKRLQHGRLYARAIFTGFKRGQRNQHPNTALLAVEKCKSKEDSRFYVGKRCVFLYKAKRKELKPHSKKKSRLRAIWGKITRPHGSSGTVRAKFHRNLPAIYMGHKVRIMLYPSNI
uniref:Large ribosomal subunit protein eL33 n=1 Tax=Cacopsylla melanoneura TaxID=428564 RepID=A0A8D8UDS8_9HEMI